MASGHGLDSKYKKFLHELNITNDYPRLKYYIRDEDNKKNVIHFGQLKLLLTEIRFLTEYHKLSNIVVYAGAAPGHHIRYLSKLFPKHQFELYDPCEFDKDIASDSKYKMINCHRQYFTDKLAKELHDKFGGDGKILFMSDIRTADYRQMTELENEECITKDNQWQLNWCRLLKPIKAMLKFRLPYPDRIKGPTIYLDGEIWIQSFARRSGTETRLIPYTDVDKNNYQYDKMKSYDHVKYEEELFFFNEKIRKSYVENIYFDSNIGFSNNFDCWSYGYLLERYLFYIKGIEMDEINDVFVKKRYVLNMVNDISSHLGINKKWLLFKQNHRSDYFNNYAIMDHRHFHDLNERKLKNVPLPKQIRGKKRKYSQFAQEDGNNDDYNDNIKTKKRLLSKPKQFDPIAFIKTIAKKFPNPDAWKDKIIELIGNNHKDIDALFKSLNGNNKNESKDKEDEKEDSATESEQQLNNLNCLLCINRMFVILCIEIPPDSSSAIKDKYLYYGLCDTSNIVSILDNNMNELYIHGILSHDNKGNSNIYKIRKVIGINREFISLQPKSDTKHNKMIDKIQKKLLSINCNKLSFTI